MSGPYNLGNYNRAMSTQSRQGSFTTGSVNNDKSIRTRVVQNNVFGKPVDKLTQEQMTTKLEPHKSIYGQDYAKNQSIGDGRSGQGVVQIRDNGPLIQKTSSKVGYASEKKFDLGEGQALKNDANAQGEKRGALRPPSQSQHDEKQQPQAQQKSATGGSHYAGDGHSHREEDDRKAATGFTYIDPKTVKDDLVKAFMSNPHIKIDSEAEYYETVRRLDVCGTCWAAQKKYHTAPFKLAQKGPGQSLYQKDYVKHPLDDKGNMIKNDFYGTFNIEEPIDFGTTMRNDYKPWKIEPQERANGAKQATSGIPFAGRTGYKAEYIDWGRMPVNYEKAPNTTTVISELPFVGKTAYQENFGPQQADPAHPVDKSKAKSPLSPGIPFLGQTTNSKTYKPFKVGGSPMFTVDNDFEPTEAYPGQYNTLYRQDYVPPHKWKCPAKIFMETHPHPRQQYLKP